MEDFYDLTGYAPTGQADAQIDLTATAAQQAQANGNSTVDMFPYFAQWLGVDEQGKLQAPAGIPANYMYANQYPQQAPAGSGNDFAAWLQKNQNAVLFGAAGLLVLALVTRKR